MVAVRIYVEGGGVSRGDQAPLRRGFQKLFEQLLGGAPKPTVIACGGRDQAFDEFMKGARAHRDAFCILLVDSEERVSEGSTAWDHLERRDKWKKPPDAEEENVHLMVTCTEAWLLADRAALKAYYGPDFKDSALPAERNVERIAKLDLARALETATHYVKTKGKGRYYKAHAFDIIALVDPAKVRAASPWAARFFDTLLQKLSLRS